MRTEKKNGNQTPRITVAVERVRELAKGLHTQAEMAALLGISHDTLGRRLKEPEYQEALQAGRDHGCAEVRSKQLKMALKGDGNLAMLIWLGKQYLGQRDIVESQVTGANGGPVELHVIYRKPSSNVTIDVEPEPRKISPGNSYRGD